jgi:hypothetical protein
MYPLLDPTDGSRFSVNTQEVTREALTAGL